MSETNKDEGKGKVETAAEVPTIENAPPLPVGKLPLFSKPRPVPDECLRAIGRIAVEWTHLEKTLGGFSVA